MKKIKHTAKNIAMNCMLYSSDHGNTWEIIHIWQLDALTKTGRNMHIDKDAIMNQILTSSEEDL